MEVVGTTLLVGHPLPTAGRASVGEGAAGAETVRGSERISVSQRGRGHVCWQAHRALSLCASGVTAGGVALEEAAGTQAF